MWWLKKKHSGEQVRTLTMSGVLDEQTFWQIVRAEKERADRSGVPVTVAVFTVHDDGAHEHTVNGWNAATLCSALRSTARLTDHVGIAGENELGAILWGTRELGAYRFVNRLGEKGEKLASDCKLFVYPAITNELPGPDIEDIDELRRNQNKTGNGILDRIAEVEEKLAQAMDVETPVVEDEEPDEPQSFDFGDTVDPSLFSNTPSGLSTETSGSTTVAAKTDTTKSTDQLLSEIEGAKTISTLADAVEAQRSSRLNVVMEPLENLFLFPHPLWKRTLDLVGAFAGLIILSPLLAAVAALVKLTSPGPALFKQLREGHGGKLFTIYKFRTMRVGADAEKAQLRADSEQDGPAFKMEQDPRITPVGSFLRKTCLDELPQLWNVLLGDMTLVGPRPLDHRESSKIARWGRRRLHVMPGLTCIWQVHGKSKVTFNEWMRMDIRYSQKVSFWQDIKLILATLQQVILRKASH